MSKSPPERTSGAHAEGAEQRDGKEPAADGKHNGKEHDVNIIQECRSIEARHPGFHIFISDEGKPWAVTAHPGAAGGSGVTLTAPGMARIEQVVAAYEWAVMHGHDPWHATAAVAALRVLDGAA